ncbi:hypothetical protein GmRootV118_02640 [Variovorax sp. V118]|uniref:P-loop NTPase n=1 Tax=Variovorax sp. V118 TaxID=3065954 RepID=UPI0034E89743
MKVKLQSWAVDGNSLRTRARRGGRVALKGFEYQASHAVHFVAQLLLCEEGLVQVRYEGAQDVDTMYGDGRQVFIQYKDTPEREYDFEGVREILHGFMCDAIDACGQPADVSRLKNLQLKFLLVSSGVVTGIEMLRLIRGSYITSLAKVLAKKFTYLANPVAKYVDRLEFAKYVVRNTSVRLSPQLAGQQHEQEILAFAKLVMFGVPPAHIQASLDSLKGLLAPPRNLFAGDAALALKGLPDFHPASGRSSLSLLPSENTFHDVAGVEREFRDSGRVSWAAIHYGLDTLRDRYEDIHSALTVMGRRAAVVLVTGSSACGKSTVVRRVAWDIHRSGKALVFEVVDPQNINLEAWSEVVRLGEIACKPTIVVCDELDSESGILEQVRRQPYAKVTVLASAKDEHVIPSPFPVHVSPHRLNAVSESEFNRLVGETGQPVRRANAAKFSTFMRAGDIFALSLALRGSSLDKIADRTLTRVNQLVPELRSAFLCLCVCGIRDQGVPRRLLLRMHAKSEHWERAQAEGLIFGEVGDRFRSGHATLAAAILRRTGANAVDLRMQLLQQVDIAEARERRFGLGLLKNGLGEQTTALASFWAQLSAFAEALANAGDYLDLARGLEIFDALIGAGLSQLGGARAKLLAAMGPDRVRTGHDAVRFMNQADDYAVAFPVVARVFAQPGISFGRNTFMRWVIDKGRGYVAQQREAVSINLRWVRTAGFPPSETTKLVNCIEHGNPDLQADAQVEFADVLKVVLEAIPLPPPNAASWELLYAICEAIGHRIRDEALVNSLLNRLEQNFDMVKLAAHPELLRRLAIAARLACGEAVRERVLRLLVFSLPDVAAAQMLKVYLALLRLVPKADMPAVLAWQDRFRKVDSAQAAATADKFVKALPAHLQPVS